MFYRRFPILFLIVAITSLLLVRQALAAAGDTTRVSISSSGVQGDGGAFAPAISADGRYVVFESFSFNLNCNAIGIQVRDRQTNTTTCISLNSNGRVSSSTSSHPAISANGRYVVFQSTDDKICWNPYGDVLILLHDMQTGLKVCIPWGSLPTISADARYVTFSSKFSLISGDTNNADDIFKYDVQADEIIERISLASNGMQGNGDSETSAISANGRYVVFDSIASNFVVGDTNNAYDIFLRDTQTNITTRLSVASDGTQANAKSYSSPFGISADGRYVVFISPASNLVTGDTNGVSDVFLRDTQVNTTTRLSLAFDGTQANGNSIRVSISANGRYIAFSSDATNLVLEDTNAGPDVFVRDTFTNTTTRVSVDSNGNQGNAVTTNNLYSGYSGNAVISADGRYVAFDSNASNLVPDDTNKRFDVFVHETGTRIATPTPPRKSALDRLPMTGFAAGKVTHLSEQPAVKAYADKGMMLEIPLLKLKASIVGVPKETESNWDLSWLGGNIGYLSGTAFPTWNGNSVLTAHVYGADGQPGPFINLETLSWGQQVIIHAWEQQYIYQVQSVKLQVDPLNTDVLTQHEDYPWLTLITCKGYDEKTNSYQWRTVVRAVLVKIEDKP